MRNKNSFFLIGACFLSGMAAASSFVAVLAGDNLVGGVMSAVSGFLWLKVHEATKDVA